MTKAEDVCVVIPIYRAKMSELEELSFKRMISVFQKRAIYLISPPSIQDYTTDLAAGYGNVTAEILSEDDFGSPLAFNRLSLKPSFYERFFDYDYLLICQLDVYVFKDDLDAWTSRDEDFFGAPIFEGYTKGRREFKNIGNNGGISLRSIKSCHRVLSEISFRFNKFSSLWNVERHWGWRLYRLIRDGLIFNYNVGHLKPVINEDLFWSAIVPQQFSWFTACKPEVGMYFAYDTNPRLLFEKSGCVYPMAIHAWWTYDREFVEGIIEAYDSEASTARMAAPVL